MGHSLPQVCLSSASNVGPGMLTRLANEAVASGRPDDADVSAIDRAYLGLLVVTQLTAASTSDWDRQHGLILSSSAVAVAEDYFRSVLTDVVDVCELCAARVKPLETRMEFVFNGSVPDAVRGMLDRESFSSSATIKYWSKKIAGTSFSRYRSLTVALAEFERVCHIRHCAVHSGGYVSTHNAGVLEVPAGSWISFGAPDAIYEIISVVTATIRSFNQSLFEVVLGEWMDSGRLTGDWAQDRTPFSQLWNTFRSRRDIESSQLSDAKLRANAYASYRSLQQSLIARSQRDG
jgi:hypothetical protein